MFSYSLVKYWYIVLTILILLAPVKISILEFLPGILLMWFLLVIFRLGTSRVDQQIQILCVSIVKIQKDTRKLSFIISMVFICFIPEYVFFYTGNGLIDMIASFSDTSNNNYNNYQKFFEENNLSNFSINKLPYIFCFAVIKFFASLVIIKIISFQKEKKIIDYCSLVLITFSFLYSSFGRGTSFELFELILIILYSFLLKIQLKQKKIKVPFKNIFQITSIALISLSYFIISISKRYGIESIIESDFEFINCTTNEFCIDKNSLLFKLTPAFSIALFQVANYFIFGIYFSSKLIGGVVFSSIEGLLSILVPNGSILFFEKSYKNLICNNIIDCGVNWIPDVTTLLMNFGIIGTLLIVFLLGKYSIKVFEKISEGSLLGSLLLFYIICFMISLPSGNFITSSSSNQLCILFSFLLFLSPFEKKYLYASY